MVVAYFFGPPCT